MIGAIIGDIVGSRFEFNNNTTYRDFDLFTKESSFTDIYISHADTSFYHFYVVIIRI